METPNHREKPIPYNSEVKTMERIKNFFKDESGASAVEYGLLVAVIAVGLIAAMGGLKNSIQASFTNTSSALNTAS